MNNHPIDPHDFEIRLKAVIAARTKAYLHDEKRRPSAVLVPIYYGGKDFRILFTRRTHLVHHHKGEISFPGGAFSAEDGTLLDTALRESSEEIGLAAKDVRVLGELDDIMTRGSPFIITPFVGVTLPDYQFILNSFETAEIIDVPVGALLAKDSRRDETEVWSDGRLVPAYIYAYQDKLIVGATARILKQFLEIYRRAAVQLQA